MSAKNENPLHKFQGFPTPVISRLVLSETLRARRAVHESPLAFLPIACLLLPRRSISYRCSEMPLLTPLQPQIGAVQSPFLGGLHWLACSAAEAPYECTHTPRTAAQRFGGQWRGVFLSCPYMLPRHASIYTLSCLAFMSMREIWWVWIGSNQKQSFCYHDQWIYSIDCSYQPAPLWGAGRLISPELAGGGVEDPSIQLCRLQVHVIPCCEGPSVSQQCCQWHVLKDLGILQALRSASPWACSDLSAPTKCFDMRTQK